MTASNHALCGALIGLTIASPVIALPLAFSSHFILDAIPHFGLDEFGGHHKKPKLFRKILYVDAILLAFILLTLLLAGASWLVFACVLLAGSPDFVWAYQYIFKENLGKNSPTKKNKFNQFHSRIQTSQTLKGIYVEAPTAVVLSAVIVGKL